MLSWTGKYAIALILLPPFMVATLLPSLKKRGPPPPSLSNVIRTRSTSVAKVEHQGRQSDLGLDIAESELQDDAYLVPRRCVTSASDMS